MFEHDLTLISPNDQIVTGVLRNSKNGKRSAKNVSRASLVENRNLPWSMPKRFLGGSGSGISVVCKEESVCFTTGTIWNKQLRLLSTRDICKSADSSFVVSCEAILSSSGLASIKMSSSASMLSRKIFKGSWSGIVSFATG